MTGLIGWSLALVAAKAGAGQDPPPVSFAYRPAAEGQAGWVAYDDRDAGMLLVDATVAGKPATALVDTGFTFTTLDTGWARGAGLSVDPSSGVALAAVGGAARVGRGPVVDLNVAPYEIRALRTLAGDLNAFSGLVGRPVSMMLGLDVIGAGALELDLGHRRWRLGGGGLAWRQAMTAPLRYTDDRYFSYAEVTVEGRPLRLWIDTGYNGALALTAIAAQTTGLFSHGRTTTLASQGMGGIVAQRLTIPARLAFGAVMLADVPVEVEEANGAAAQRQLDGVIGIGLLRRLHVAFDFPAGTMFYRASDVAQAPTVRSTIGLQAVREGAALSVVHVMAGGPAAAAGWRAGERICAIDGTKIHDMAKVTGPSRWNTARAGTKVTFGMCDGTARTLEARDFY